MRIGVLMIASIVVQGCDYGPSNRDTVNLEATESAPPEIQSKKTSVWTKCPSTREMAYFGNRWWGELEVCAGDVRVALRAESEDLGGPTLTAIPRTAACPVEGKVMKLVEVADGFFTLSAKEQETAARDAISLAVRGIPDRCGGPYDPDPLLAGDFSRRFEEFGQKYWH